MLTDATADVAMALILSTARRVVEGDRQVRWDELVTRSDYLSVHVPLAQATHHLVDRDVLRRMKPEAVLVNTARGGRARARGGPADRGEIAGAGLDVYEDEPRLAPGLADLPNTVLLPHVGSATVPVRRGMSRLSALDAIAMAEGLPPPHAVNPEAMS